MSDIDDGVSKISNMLTQLQEIIAQNQILRQENEALRSRICDLELQRDEHFKHEAVMRVNQLVLAAAIAEYKDSEKNNIINPPVEKMNVKFYDEERSFDPHKR